MLAGGSGATDSLEVCAMEEDGDEDEFDEEVDAGCGGSPTRTTRRWRAGTAVLVTCAAILAQLDYSAVMGVDDVF